MNASALLTDTVAIARKSVGVRVPIVGIAGSQGSGKTTLMRQLADTDPSIAAFSLDDVYLPRAYRDLIAADVHPLFSTRGPPGTHNLMQLTETLDELQEAGPKSATILPGFDKVADNPMPEIQRPVFLGRPSLILLDGWCLGATPQADADLAAPVNDLEADEDAYGVWRREINANLAGAYQDTFARLDAILFLRRPQFRSCPRLALPAGGGPVGPPADGHGPPADRPVRGAFRAHYPPYAGWRPPRRYRGAAR